MDFNELNLGLDELSKILQVVKSCAICTRRLLQVSGLVDYERGAVLSALRPSYRLGVHNADKIRHPLFFKHWHSTTFIKTRI